MLIEFQSSSLMKHVVTKLRDQNTEAKEFRYLLKKLGSYLTYEAAKNIQSTKKKIDTPVASTECEIIDEDITVLSILRAALPMSDGVMEEFDDASLGVISASRGEMIGGDGTEFKIEGGYAKIPDINENIVFIVDPMLATGSTIKFLLGKIKEQSPIKIILLCAIASEYGVKAIEEAFPDVEIYCGAIDAQLNDHGYIVPGLGDAGDRAFNTPH